MREKSRQSTHRPTGKSRLPEILKMVCNQRQKKTPALDAPAFDLKFK